MPLPLYEWEAWNETTGVQNKRQKIVYISLSCCTVLQIKENLHDLKEWQLKFLEQEKETFLLK